MNDSLVIVTMRQFAVRQLLRQLLSPSSNIENVGVIATTSQVMARVVLLRNS